MSPIEYTDYMEDLKGRIVAAITNEFEELSPGVPPSLLIGALEEVKLGFYNAAYYEVED